MPTLTSWIRESDEALFQRFFDLSPGLRVLNARTTGVDAGDGGALLLTGGADIDAAFLRQDIPDPSVIEKEADAARDTWEFAAASAALEAGKPILAICKGLQVLNVALGGTLHLDIPGHDLPEQRDGNIQPLRFSGSPAHRFEKVNSSHHQALDQLGDGLEVEAWHAGDGAIEQVRRRGDSFVVGVQYHPERDLLYTPLFDDFLSHISQK